METPPRPFSESGEVLAFSGGDGGADAACFTCHGMAGEGDGRSAPRLAGLDAGYLHRQLDDYANGRRDHAMMYAVARDLTQDDRAQVAAYYASLPPAAAPPPVDPVSSASGARLYDRGDPARGIASCASCHGATGQGDAANPPLAGQSATYIADQLNNWREGRRHNDPLGQMMAISRALTPDQISAVAAHAAAFPMSRPLAIPAASRSERRADPRNDVSAPPRREPES